VTGLSYYATELTGKRLEILREMVPSISAVGVLANPAVAYLPFEEDTKRAAATLGIRVSLHQVPTAADRDDAFKAMTAEHLDAVFVLPTCCLAPRQRTSPNWRSTTACR